MKNALRWLALVVVHVVLFAVGSAVFAPKLETPLSDADAALMFPTMFVVAAIDAALILIFVRASRLRGWRLYALVASTFYFVKTATSLIEAIVFMPNVSRGMLPQLFAMTVPLALGLPALAVWLGGRSKPSALDQTPGFVKIPLSRLQMNLRVALLSSLGYPFLFFVAGYYIAFASPELRTFYGGTYGATFFAHLETIDPLVFALEALRGALWVACGIAIMRTMRGPWWASTLFVALWFALIQNDVHFMPNPLMTGTIRLFHFIETASSNFVWAWLIGWSLHVTARNDVPRVDQLQRLPTAGGQNHAA